MKFLLLLVLLGLNVPFQLNATAQEMSSKKEDRGQNRETERCFWAAGVVRKIDDGNGIVTIFHDAVLALAWPSMTMPFAVKDKSILRLFKVGDKVEFKFVIEERNSVIVGVR